MNDLQEHTLDELPTPAEHLPEPAETPHTPENPTPDASSAQQPASVPESPAMTEIPSVPEIPSAPEALSNPEAPSEPEASPESPASTTAPAAFAKLGFFRSVIAGIFVLALAFFTVLVEHVRRSKQFGFSTTPEFVTTGIQVVIYVVLFVIGWKLLDLFDRKAVLAEGEAAADGSADRCAVLAESEATAKTAAEFGGDAKAKTAAEFEGEATSEDAAARTAAAELSAAIKPSASPAAAEPSANDEAPAPRKPASHLLFSWSPRSVILTWILLLCLFVPYLLVFYPGVASMDTTNQIKDFTTGTMPIEINWNEGEPKISCFLNDHHPVVDTLIFTFFTEFVGGILGGPVRGAFAYCALQAALTALLMSLMLCRMEKFGVPYAYRTAGFLFLGFASFIGLYAIGMLKDSI